MKKCNDLNKKEKWKEKKERVSTDTGLELARKRID